MEINFDVESGAQWTGGAHPTARVPDAKIVTITMWNGAWGGGRRPWSINIKMFNLKTRM